jgi:hypothetical protein
MENLQKSLFLSFFLLANACNLLCQSQNQLQNSTSTIPTLNQETRDSIFSLFAARQMLFADSLPVLSCSPSDFVLYINNLQEKELAAADSFATKHKLDSLTTALLFAKITYKNVLALLEHPMKNGFFDVQENSEIDESVKAFYRASYKDYSLFLDTLLISHDFYLQVPEYVEFIEFYLDYQERRYHILNQTDCPDSDRYWLIKFLFWGQVRKFLATKELENLLQTHKRETLTAILQDFEKALLQR